MNDFAYIVLKHPIHMNFSSVDGKFVKFTIMTYELRIFIISTDHIEVKLCWCDDLLKPNGQHSSNVDMY